MLGDAVSPLPASEFCGFVGEIVAEMLQPGFPLPLKRFEPTQLDKDFMFVFLDLQPDDKQAELLPLRLDLADPFKLVKNGLLKAEG